MSDINNNEGYGKYKNQVIIWFNYMGPKDDTIKEDIEVAIERLDLYSLVNDTLEDILGYDEETDDYVFDEYTPDDQEVIEEIEKRLKSAIDNYIKENEYDCSIRVKPYLDGSVNLYVSKNGTAKMSSDNTFDMSPPMLKKWTKIAKMVMGEGLTADVNLIIYVVDLISTTGPICIFQSL